MFREEIENEEREGSRGAYARGHGNKGFAAAGDGGAPPHRPTGNSRACIATEAKGPKTPEFRY